MRHRVTLGESMRKAMSGWTDFYVARGEGNVFLRVFIGLWDAIVGEPEDPAGAAQQAEHQRAMRSGNPRRRSHADD